MKKILLATLLIPAILKAQPYIGASLGTYKVINKEVNSTTYALGVHMGVKASIFFIEAEERVDLLTRKASNNYFGGKIGLSIPIQKLSISPFVGYYYNYVSADNKFLNRYYNAYGLRFDYQLKKSWIYVEGLNMNSRQVTLGFSYKITDKNPQ